MKSGRYSLHLYSSFPTNCIFLGLVGSRCIQSNFFPAHRNLILLGISFFLCSSLSGMHLNMDQSPLLDARSGSVKKMDAPCPGRFIALM